MCVERYAADGGRTQQVLHPGRQLWVPLDGFKMQTSGAMVCDSHHAPSTELEALVVVSRTSHHVPSTGLEALVVVSRCSIIGLAGTGTCLLLKVPPGRCNDWHFGER